MNNVHIKKLIGKATIHPILFYTGKIAGYITWIILILFISGVQVYEITIVVYRVYISYLTGLAGLLFIIISLINLGKSTRLGLPVDNTSLKTTGIYKISRNPMYVGFNLMTISSMIYTLNLIIFLLGMYSLFIYHLIIIREEQFLERRFGQNFISYKKKVRRYL